MFRIVCENLTQIKKKDILKDYLKGKEKEENSRKDKLLIISHEHFDKIMPSIIFY